MPNSMQLGPFWLNLIDSAWPKFNFNLINDQDDDLRARAQILQNLRIGPSTFWKLHFGPNLPFEFQSDLLGLASHI